jgi:hypothetical protein
MGFTAHLIPWFGTLPTLKRFESSGCILTMVSLGIATAFVVDAEGSVSLGTVALQQAIAMFVLGKQMWYLLLHYYRWLSAFL